MKRFIRLFLFLVVLQFSCEKNEEIASESTSTIQKVKKKTYTEAELYEVLHQELDLIASKNNDLVNTTMPLIKDNPKKVYVHYMPWFQTPEYDGYWGQHWTMNNQNPNQLNFAGQRDIASYYYPLIGPYSSSDPDLQEYHFLLMKLSGIDGVIFDWYGSRNLYDYQTLKNATESFMGTLEDMGMPFSIMYEDRVATQFSTETDASDYIEAARVDFNYIKDTYISSPQYLTQDDLPLIFVFGPNHIERAEDWETIFDGIFTEGQIHFLTLWASRNKVGSFASGEFLWVAPDHLIAHEHYYSYYENQNEITVGSVYPGFHSFYEEGGWQEGVHQWVIEKDEGYTFTETLNYTHEKEADIIQIVTWNDFGEGTMIEPTYETGYEYLVQLQEYTGAPYTIQDLEAVTQLYLSRKNHQDNTKANLLLDRSYLYLKNLNIERADMIVKAVNRFL